MQPSRTFMGVALVALMLLQGKAEAAARPERVVSMNVCTDQLAAMLAHPGQLHSVSWLAADPGISVLADRMGGYVVNRGLAEEIFLMKPDLIIAGTYTTRATVNLLRRLGFRVEEFEPASSFKDIRHNIRRMARLLDNVNAGEELVAKFDADLVKLHRSRPEVSKLALYYANSYTSGSNTLADEIVAASGLRNLGKELGYEGTTKLPLEVLVSEEPDLVAGRERDFGYPSKADENFLHPAYKAIAKGDRGIAIDSKYWVCGAPFTLQAAFELSAFADQSEPKSETPDFQSKGGTNE